MDQLKELREMTGVSMMACKKALEEAEGDIKMAVDVLRKKGEAKAVERGERSTGQGVIATYLHTNAKIGVMVQLGCETDFVAKNDEFLQVAKDIAMHIAASDPADTKVLLEQPFIKDLSLTISDYINGFIQKFGENIEVERFERFFL